MMRRRAVASKNPDRKEANTRMFPAFDYTTTGATIGLAFGKGLTLMVVALFALFLGKMLLAGLLAPVVGGFEAASSVVNVVLMAGAFCLLAWVMGPGQEVIAGKVYDLTGGLLDQITAPFQEIARVLETAGSGY